MQIRFNRAVVVYKIALFIVLVAILFRHGYQVGARCAMKRYNYKTAVYNMFLLMDMRKNLMAVPASTQTLHHIDPKRSDIRIWGIVHSLDSNRSDYEDWLSSLDDASREIAKGKIAEAKRIADTVKALPLHESVLDMQ